MTRLRWTVVAAAALAAAACASAGKRFEQGGDAAARGDWYGAASRYVDALEKDPTMSDARAALMEAGDSAVQVGLADARSLTDDGDPVSAGVEFRRLDRLIQRTRDVRVSLPLPGDYTSLRRETFDAAVDQLMADADDARYDHRFAEARDAYRRIRRDFEPNPTQERASLDAEAALQVAWGEAEADAHRFRSAYDHAGQALAVRGPLPRDVADAADALQQTALSNGLHVLAVFPIDVTSQVEGAEETDLRAQLSDLLELDAWRRPPLFVAVAAPAAVRQITRRMFPPGTTLRPGRLLEEVGGDFGALITLTRLTVTERDVKSTPHTARTRQGREASWTEEEGQWVYEVEASITFFDARGYSLGSTRARARKTGHVHRGVYGGDPAQLELSRSERLLFDAGALRRQRADLEGDLLADLAPDVAEKTFDFVVNRIP